LRVSLSCCPPGCLLDFSGAAANHPLFLELSNGRGEQGCQPLST
jgi:hypothetical protein